MIVRLKKPKTRYELYKKVVMLYYKSEYTNIGAYNYDRSVKFKQRKKLKAEVQELLQMWEEIRI